MNAVKNSQLFGDVITVAYAAKSFVRSAAISRFLEKYSDVQVNADVNCDFLLYASEHEKMWAMDIWLSLLFSFIIKLQCFIYFSGDLRVCTYCCKVVLSYLQSPDVGVVLTADLLALQENLQNKYGATSPGLSLCGSQTALDHLSPQEPHENIRRKISVGYQEEKFAIGRYDVSCMKLTLHPSPKLSTALVLVLQFRIFSKIVLSEAWSASKIKWHTLYFISTVDVCIIQFPID